ncbi:platelet-activating factor acetylhydrolase isoform II [Pseudoduganella lurida]|uniref:Platelet-activating factor acetylhydrolase isoform II n=1 Tax=Pseudoduganella lurida TaxID=1036180 RepID=A0A562RLN8_9BURK|nr:dienelactone hydrolase [Pseudoduganella lurida]TWI69366.1 platelet-activating factor acetylhydrolase isoform II [Pseudoduganella lurida]
MKLVAQLAMGIAVIAAWASQSVSQAADMVPVVEYFGDARPDAPELAARGPLAVGVRTQAVDHAGQLDILKATAGTPEPRYTRRLTLEVWYPAALASGQAQHTVYTDVLGSGANDPARPNTPFQFAGRAARDARPAAAPAGGYPLVIVSHGYPGSRLQMSYLTENLASKGYVVVAVDHPESTRADKAGFPSTLLNRPLDDLFVLQTVAGWSKPGSGHFLAGLVDPGRTALVGYSMGGYGALNAVGAGISPAAVAFVPGGGLAVNQQGNAQYEARRDPRIKAVVAIAPWGGAHKIWDDAGLAGVRTPTLFISGDQDDVAGYQDGVRRLFQGAVHADRYLLTYRGARHNTAPNPVSPAAIAAGFDDYMAYAEPVWDSRRINNINQHFVTAFLGMTLRGEPLQGYLDLPPLPAGGTAGRDTVTWKGFRERTALGLELLHLPAQ